VKRAAALALLAWLCTPAAWAEPLQLTATPIESFAPEDGPTGSLQFLGGLVLSSDDGRFGGLSGIEVLDNGNAVIMVSDTGMVVRAGLAYDGDRLTGLTEVEIDPLFPGGEVSKDLGDIEDIALDPETISRGVLVRERQANAMLSFDLADGLPANLEPQRVGAPNSILRSNHGLESVTYAPAASPIAGEIVAIAERPPRGASDIPAWIAGRGAFSIVRHDDFDIASARFLPNGDLLLLERRFGPTIGLAIRLRQIAGDAIEVGARLDGDVLLDAGMASQIDNMEGLAVHQDEAGRTILTLVSDDNHNILQRTLLLQFALAEA
jgi:hypothetical protein